MKTIFACILVISSSLVHAFAEFECENAPAVPDFAAIYAQTNPNAKCMLVERVSPRKNGRGVAIAYSFDQGRGHFETLDENTSDLAKEARKSKGELLLCEEKIEGQRSYYLKDTQLTKDSGPE